jgi:hypothetical protein
MATDKKIFKRGFKRSSMSYYITDFLFLRIYTVSGTPVNTDQVIDHVLQAAVEWSNDHEFISPHEVYKNSIGLLFCLTTRKLINASFMNLYRRR